MAVSGDRRILLDGGMGRELKRMGAPFRQPEWSALALMEAPDTVTRAHQGYVDAGADVITTNNYAVVPFHLGEARYASDGRRLTALSGELARRVADAAGRDVRVAGALPPLFGSYRPDLFQPARAAELLPGIVAALDPWIDLWLAETMGSLAEYHAISAALAGSDKPFWASFTVSDEAEDAGRCLRSGEPVEAVYDEVSAGPAEAMLLNCSQPEFISEALRRVSTRAGDAGGLRLGAYANAFEPRPKDALANTDQAILRTELDPPRYLEFVRRWVDTGATIVGGCCGIGPDHIRMMHEWMHT